MTLECDYLSNTNIVKILTQHDITKQMGKVGIYIAKKL